MMCASCMLVFAVAEPSSSCNATSESVWIVTFTCGGRVSTCSSAIQVASNSAVLLVILSVSCSCPAKVEWCE